MHLTPNMELLLTAILADVKRLEATPDRPAPGMDRDDWREQYLERQEYRQAGVRHDLDRWLGYPPSRSDSAVFSRALRQMEDMGLLVRVNRWGGSSRATHVRLTPRGRAEAERLVADHDAAMAALLKDFGLPVEGSGAEPPGTDRQDARNPLDSPSPPR
jgi:hypothetical protein